MGTDGEDEQQATDSQLAERCQELEAEVAKLMEVNQEIYDRALEMEERALQLEAKISDMEEEAEHLTMQLQNSYALGYKKGQADMQAELDKAAQTQPAPAQPTSIKSMIDFELPPEEKAEEKVAEKSQSIKSMIDFELSPEEKTAFEHEAQANEAARHHEHAEHGQQDDGKDTAENPPVFGEDEIVANNAPQPVAQAGEAVPSYNDRTFNAAGDSPAGSGDSYGGMSWREVETIYQHSASDGLTGASLMFEPMTPGQAAGVPGQNAAAGGEPPILKADASAPVQNATMPPNPPKAGRENTHNPANIGQKKYEAQEPPMELTMHQFLGDTDSYLNLDRVTLEPPEELLPPPQQAARPSQEETQTLQGARDQLEAMTRQAKNQAAEAAQNQAAQAKATASQTAQNLEAQRAEAEAFGQTSGSWLTNVQAADSPGMPQGAQVNQFMTPPEPPAPARLYSPFENPNSFPAGQSQPAASSPLPSHDLQEAKQHKRDASATYDGLNALESESTADVLDLEKLDIFEGLEDMDELSQIEVIEDVILPGSAPQPPITPPAPQSTQAEPTKPKYNTSDRVPAVSSDDLHDLIKSRIKKAEEPHEVNREAFVSHHEKPQAASEKAAVADEMVTGTVTGGTAAESAAATGSHADANSVQAAAASTEAAQVPTAKELEALRQGARNKFVGGKAAPTGTATSTTTDSLGNSAAAASPAPAVSPRSVPPEIRKACMILGVRPEDMTVKEVNEKWKSQMASGAHPDQGGDTESAIYLNTAKDTLVKWLNDQGPKLGKKFGKKE